MGFYLHEIGQIGGGYPPKSEQQWDKMLKGTHDECIAKFFHYDRSILAIWRKLGRY